MNQWTGYRQVWVLLSVLLLQACTAMQSSIPPSPMVFVAASPDAAMLLEMAREQERRLATCATPKSCDRAHYIRALLALYEDRALAVKHFEAVVSGTPDSSYAVPSLQWLRLLEQEQNGTSQELRWSQVAERLVRQVLNQELEVYQAAARSTHVVEEVKNQLKERDKKIEELTGQIEALKQVDQQVKGRVRPKRPAN